jgi:hypothetical protein
MATWSSKHSHNKNALATIKPNLAWWHHRLVHASLPIVQCVVSRNKLSCLKEASSKSVCDACQRAKSHQLLFPISSSVSKAPLELIFSDVWDPTPMSVGMFMYYASFIDDYSKFSWVYLLRNKSDVFRKFHEFQQLVECQFNTKILTIQSDLGGGGRG